MTTFKFIKENS